MEWILDSRNQSKSITLKYLFWIWSSNFCIFVSFEEETRLGREEKEPMMEFSIRKYCTGIEEDCHRSR
jgi:hypothetical protein